MHLTNFLSSFCWFNQSLPYKLLRLFIDSQNFMSLKIEEKFQMSNVPPQKHVQHLVNEVEMEIFFNLTNSKPLLRPNKSENVRRGEKIAFVLNLWQQFSEIIELADSILYDRTALGV